jgi:hypothetical protein
MYVDTVLSWLSGCTNIRHSHTYFLQFPFYSTLVYELQVSTEDSHAQNMITFLY